MPHVTLVEGERAGNAIYQVGGRSFVFFRTPRPDALDEHGERLPDVIVIWVPDEEDKLALVQDPCTPFFTTPHFDGHPSVLVRASRLGEISRRLLRELIEDAWMSQTSATRRRAWEAAQGRTGSG
ncbi:hypothetical protein SAMN05414137_11731 [Streptacidiphilus jiangxiensis]|uniref:YjbR protein n=2 Tax=Streptacidiphilus jiangxiensis TaxID=235985 RepID=A0A1H7V2P2_STRJI|nr:hypothetical protein SAMN05414137_11731 [Streptacidiphilus jiangxiensis]